MPEPEKKLDRLVRLIHAGDWTAALSLAAKFQRLGPEKSTIVRAHECLSHPEFYRQLGYDLDAAIAAGCNALRLRYAKFL